MNTYAKTYHGVSDDLDHAAYAAARAEYQKVIAEQAESIKWLRSSLASCKSEWIKTTLENKRMRTALVFIASGGVADPDTYARSVLEEEVI